ncbi:MAG TPA: hypothetical protein VLA14_16745 [Polyangia bacterium]|nr:hypothetical protein [Polyangia bacterium]
MRLPGLIFAELTVAATVVAGGGYGAVRGAREVRAVLASHAAASRMAFAPPTPRKDLSALPDLRIALEASGTFMGMSDELLLERVRTQPIVRFKLNHGGSSISFRIDFADGSRAAWKPTQTNLQTIPRKEVAAYRLNRLLGLNAVPPAAPRAVGRDELLTHLHPESLALLPRIEAETIFGPGGKTVGTASYWIPVIKDSGFDTPQGQLLAQTWLSQGQHIPSDQRDMAAQLSDLAVFDFLTANPDRLSGGNMKMSPDGKQLYYMDNTMSFFVEPAGNLKTREALMKVQRFSRGTYAALDRISVPTLEQVLAEETGTPYEILTPAEIKAVVARRDVVRQYVAVLINQFGASDVLAFP